MPGRRRHIPNNVKKMVVQMDQLDEPLSRAEIRHLTGVAESTQRRILSLHSRTGEVAIKAVPSGRKRILNAMDAAFLEGCIERNPDLTLLELQKALQEVCGARGSMATISRTLRRRGFTRKKVISADSFLASLTSI
ncbi:hypothetical protein HYDPIDRAFT_95132 [Hydnomerulius pinastri MD-312]|uniref:Transposase Tc1-like domain-containing protein n=1 Tax=Hydnomerulius pinastri MD-312 TaxID=994086 RepID=A0A0C9W7V0_9AGAM|nr:hypothetical protein HYDPIDRAFT_102315 [Hydnomerulius pinastri MD-312]KIJ62197.1 hypothetical protein HYDPIDRAFT_95132 [Hydnomerulius pinastri MD-312]